LKFSRYYNFVMQCAHFLNLSFKM